MLNLQIGSTVSAVGGTLVPFIEQKQEGNVRHFTVASDPLLTRRNLKLKIVEPTVNKSSPSGYTQSRGTITVQKPVILTNGERTVISVQLVLSTDMETSDTEKEELLDYIAETISSGELRDNLVSNTQA